MKSFAQFITESHILGFEKKVELDKWHNDELARIESQYSDFKLWHLHNSAHMKEYFKRKAELEKQYSDIYGMKGDRQSKFVYHYTTSEGLLGILETDTLDSGGVDSYGYGGVAVSTHPNLYKYGFIFWWPSEYSEGKTDKNVGVKIKLDFKKLQSDGLKFISGSEELGTHVGEFEFRSKQDAIPNISKYIVEILIFKQKEPNYKELVNALSSTNLKFKVI